MWGVLLHAYVPHMPPGRRALQMRRYFLKIDFRDKYPFDVDIVSGRYTVNTKSLPDIFAL